MEHHWVLPICLLLALAAPGTLASTLSQEYVKASGRGLLQQSRPSGPEQVDWSSVLLACKRLGEYERRFHGFNIRSAFHDGLSVDQMAGTGGMDGSIFTQQEMSAVQNSGFTAASWRVVKTISLKYGCSVADALAACGAVGVQELSGGRTKIIGPNGQRNFPVGRMDNPFPTQGRIEVIPPDADVTQAFSTWARLGFTVEEAVALLGAHALFDNQGCSRSTKPNDECDPFSQSCANQVAMFKWDPHYYHNACTGTLAVVAPRGEQPASQSDLQKALKEVKCAYTSREYQDKRSNAIIQDWNNNRLTTVIHGVVWNNDQCDNTRSFGVRNYCPHRTDWPYTQNDAHMGRACQGLDLDQHPNFGPKVRDAMRKFLDQNAWDRVFAPAYIQMVSKFAMWYRNQKVMINGLECPSGYMMDATCAKGMNNYDARKLCDSCSSTPAGGSGCHKCCICSTAWMPSRDKLVPEPVPFTTSGFMV